jgi:uncharacterized membrane protein SpoIIM required for sporulation/uncharacterized RDD family membrane protein YckC
MTEKPTSDRTLRVETPEQVAVGYELAGPGSRFAAFLLDGILLFFLVVTVAAAAGFTLVGVVGLGIAQLTAGWILALVTVVLFVLVWGYFVAFEAYGGGRTPGKRWMGLRVIQASGFPLSLPGAAIRNLVRILDLQPGVTGLVGGVFILFHPRAQRPGDLAADTVVIRERPVETLAQVAGRAASSASDASEPPGAPLLPDPAWALLDAWAARRPTLDRGTRRKVAGTIHASLAPSAPDHLPLLRDSNPRMLADRQEEALEVLHAEESARRAGSGDATTWGSPSAAALLRRQRDRWILWDRVLGRAQDRGLPALVEKEVAAFASLYREVTADLARARTYRASPPLLAALESSVGRGYNLLYTAPRRPPLELVKAFTRGFPRLVRSLLPPVGIAALLFFGPALATFGAVVGNPSLAEDLVPTVLLERARAAESLEAQGIGYGEAVISEGEMPIAAASILTNNVRVTFMAFVGGILAGVGTVLVLVLNGVMLGGAAAAFYLEGQSLHLWAFVLPHGVLELSAICLAGGAGLWMGSAFVLPGRRTRGDALAARALDAVRLLGGVVVLLVVAGVIEGFISPSPALSDGAKIAFGLLTAAVLFPWLIVGGAAEPPPEPGAGSRSEPDPEHPGRTRPLRAVRAA